MKLIRPIRIAQSKPLPFRGGVGVGPVSEHRARRTGPTPSPKGEGLIRFILIALCLVATPLSAQNTAQRDMANVQLADPRQEDEATTLMETLRCIQCQGQSIADSDAPIAAAMRSEVRQRISGGESPEQIRRLMVQRYGDWVSFQPGADVAGMFLWLLPLLILVGGIWFARGLFTRKAK